MALNNGDPVALTGSISAFGNDSLGFGGGGAPLFGIVEDASGPTIVDWENGKRSSYTVATYLLLVTSASNPTQLLYHQRVILGNSVANPYGASVGTVIAVFAITSVDYVLVKFKNGDVATFLASDVTLYPTNSNVTAQ